MRYYRSCKHMISEVFRNLSEHGIEVPIETMQDKKVKDDKDYLTKELYDVNFTIYDISDYNLMHAECIRKFGIDYNKKWADAEFDERVSAFYVNPGEAWKLRKEIWEEFIHDGKFSYSYNHRITPYLGKLRNEIKKNPHSRQLIIPIYKGRDVKNIGAKARVPCSMFYQFTVRDIETWHGTNGEHLHLRYVMRSTDLLTHFINDIYLACKLLHYMAAGTKYPPGFLTFTTTSMHAYMKDFNKLKNVF